MKAVFFGITNAKRQTPKIMDPNENAEPASVVEEPVAAAAVEEPAAVVEAVVEEAVEPEQAAEEKPKYVLFMGNLTFTVTKEKIIGFFQEKELEVMNLRIPTDKFKGDPKGFAFVEFNSSEAMATALTMNDTELMGRQVKIETTTEKRRDPDQPKKDREEWSDGSKVELRFAVPSPYVRKIIGKKGETIKRLSKESGARAMFGEKLPESWTLGNDLQHLSISGSLTQIQACVSAIVKEMVDFEEEHGKVDEYSRAAKGHVSLTMLVPVEKIPMVIGQRGGRIKEIERLSKTVVDVQEDQVYSEKYVTFTGEKDEVGNAVFIAAKGLPVDTWDPSRPCVTPKTRENGGKGGGGKGGGKGGSRGGGGDRDRGGRMGGGKGKGRYDDYRGPPSPRFRGPPPRDYDDRYARGPPPRGPPRGYDDYYDRGPPLKRSRGPGGGGYDRGPPPPRGGGRYMDGGYGGGGGGYDRAPPSRGGDDFW